MLYTYRSCSNALPMIQQSTPDHLRAEINRRVFSIIRPEIATKMSALMHFQNHAIAVIKGIIEKVIIPVEKSKRGVQSSMILDMIVKCINTLVLANAMKDMKPCILNDFTRYKRAFGSLKQNGDSIEQMFQHSGLQVYPTMDEIVHEQVVLQDFLVPAMSKNKFAPQFSIMFNLKTEVQTLPGYDLAAIKLANHCVDAIDHERYLMPEEKHTFYRVLPNLMYILDSDMTKTVKDRVEK